MQTDCFPDAIEVWDKAPISKLATINPRYPIRKNQEYPFIEMASVAGNFGGIIRLDTRKLESSGLSRFKVGDTLFAKITPCPENGKVAIVANLPEEPGLGSTEFIVLSPKGECVPRFLYHLTCCHSVRGRAIARMEGSTGRQRVPVEVFTKRLLVPIPSPEEQAAIASVLDAVDTVISHTYKAVEAAGDLRRSVLQGVFTFKNSREMRKETIAGSIPCSWDVIKGKQAFVIVSGGCSSVDIIKKLRPNEKPDAWFMKVDDFNTPQNKLKIVRTEVGFRATENPKFKALHIGTVIIAKRGAAILKNRVRTTAVPVALDPNLMAIQTLPGMRPDFLKYQLQWRNLSRYMEDSGVPQLNNKDLYPRHFLKAPPEVQREIETMISTTESYQDSLSAKLEALKNVKASLMYDLLTGRVRVKEVLGKLEAAKI